MKNNLANLLILSRMAMLKKHISMLFITNVSTSLPGAANGFDKIQTV